MLPLQLLTTEFIHLSLSKQQQ